MKLRKKTAVIIPVRLDSERLPGKALMKLYEDYSTLDIIIHRLKKCNKVDDIILAIAEDNDFMELQSYAINNKISFFIGDKDDVLLRTLNTAKHFNIDTIVDITADCPLVMPELIDFVIMKHKSEKNDYTSNVLTRTWPDGFDIQVYSTEALELVNMIIPKDSTDREHTGWNIPLYNLSMGEKLKLKNYTAPAGFNYPEWGLTLDTKEDLQVMRKIFSYFDSIDFNLFELMDYVRNNDLLSINKLVKRNKVKAV